VKLSEEERAANRAAFKAMGPAQKADYIFAYYKLPLVLALVAVVALGSVAWRAITHKDALLYVAFVNVAPPLDVDEALTSGFVEATGADPGREEVLCYRELYLSNSATVADHQYAYASKLKAMAAVEGHQLDVVLMNREAYDLLSTSGYLLDLTADEAGAASSDDAAGTAGAAGAANAAGSADKPGVAGPAGAKFADDTRLCSNTVVIDSNQVEYELGEASTYEAKTVEVANALEVTQSPLLHGFSGNEALYLGVIANSPRQDQALAYLAYVAG
jgi:hypothetical protein